MTVLLFWANRPFPERALDTARELVADHPEVAAVTAQTAVEIEVERAFAVLLGGRLASEPLSDAVLALLPDRTFMDRRTRRLWTALTGDRISDAHGWSEYQAAVERRNAAVHAGGEMSNDEALRALDAIESLIAHVEATVRRVMS